MPLILIVRFLTSVMSVAILAAAAYFLWRWYDGVDAIDSAGVVYNLREDWPLWAGLAALAWSLMGRLIVTPFLAGRDTRVLKLNRSNGSTVSSQSGSKLYVETHGNPDGPTIVLTHGWGLDSTIWGYAISDLETEFRVVVWDLPGLGKSRGKVDLESFAIDLRAVIEDTEAQKVFLVGHSIGGMTIQTLARQSPAFVSQRVAGIVLLNTTYTNPLRTMILSRLMRGIRWPLLEPLLWLTIPLQLLAWMSAWQSYFSGSAHLANRIGFGKHVTKSELNATALLGTRNPPAALARGNLAMFRWDATDALKGLAVPTLIIAGAVDIVTKATASHAIAAQARSKELMVVDDVNHMGFLEAYETYHEAIADFVVRHRGASAIKSDAAVNL